MFKKMNKMKAIILNDGRAIIVYGNGTYEILEK